MKKTVYALLLCCFLLTLFLSLGGCGGHLKPISTIESTPPEHTWQPIPHTDDTAPPSTNTTPLTSPSDEKPTTEAPDATENTEFGEGRTVVQEGEIVGDVFYKGIPIGLLFREHNFKEILGEPYSHSYGPYYFYDGLEVTYSVGVESMQLTNLGLFEINGITLDKSREELIAAFGDPIDHFIYADIYDFDGSVYYSVYCAAAANRGMVYHLSGNLVDFKIVLSFWFDSPYEKAKIASISRMHNQEREGKMLTINDAQFLLQEAWFRGYVQAEYVSGMDKHEDGVRHYGFSLDYRDVHMNYSPAAYIYAGTKANAWVNSVTGEILFEEIDLYANVPDSMIPTPMNDGGVIPYTRFWPPYYDGNKSTYYVYADNSVMESYEEQLRDAGFIYRGYSESHFSLWEHERSYDGAVVAVRMYPLGKGAVIDMYVYRMN